MKKAELGIVEPLSAILFFILVSIFGIWLFSNCPTEDIIVKSWCEHIKNSSWLMLLIVVVMLIILIFLTVLLWFKKNSYYEQPI